MPLYLIKITKRRWDRPTDAPWLPEDEIPADPLGDLRPKEGKLSVWLVDAQSSNLDGIIVALALTREKWDNFEYGLFDSSIPERLGIRFFTTEGTTPLIQINRFHRDLAELTADKYTQLIKEVFPQLRKERLYEEEVKQKVRIAQTTTQIDEQRLNEKIRPRFQALRG
jgi:hypothetical protein